MRPHRPISLALASLIAAAAIGCGSAVRPSGPAGDPPPTSAAVTASGPAEASPTAGASKPLAVAPAEAWLLVGRPGVPGLQLIRSATGEVDLDLPAGSPRSDWQRIASATIDGAATVVSDTAVQPGLGGPEVRIDGRWRLPTVGLDPIPAGRSLDGSTIALVEDPAGRTPGLSRFAIVEHALAGAVQTAGDAPLRLARIVELRGAFEYDTLSPDGRILYVVEHLDASAGGRYQVRAVDVGSGIVRDGVIVDKSNPDERMAGAPIAQERLTGGLVLTLYRGPEHPFVHALMSAEAWAICIDLPGDAARDAGVVADDWDLAPSPDASSVYAVNASLGRVVEIGAGDLGIRRSASIATAAGGPVGTAVRGPAIVLAKFGHSELGPVGRRAVVSPDGATLFAAGANGIAVIGTRELTSIRTDVAGVRVDSVGLTPDGRTLFALTAAGTIRIIDAGSGRDLGAVPGAAADRIVAVAPW